MYSKTDYVNFEGKKGTIFCAHKEEQEVKSNGISVAKKKKEKEKNNERGKKFKTTWNQVVLESFY